MTTENESTTSVTSQTMKSSEPTKATSNQGELGLRGSKRKKKTRRSATPMYRPPGGGTSPLATAKVLQTAPVVGEPIKPEEPVVPAASAMLAPASVSSEIALSAEKAAPALDSAADSATEAEKASDDLAQSLRVPRPGRGEVLDVPADRKSKIKSEKVIRRFSTEGIDPLDEVTYATRSSQIRGADGDVVFGLKEVEVPENWSQLATDIVVSKYFRRAGVGGTSDGETSVKQVIQRIAHTIRVEGERAGYFGSKEEASVYEAELKYLLVHQMGAFNSPVWFNLGLWHEYGIEGSGGNFTFNQEKGQIVETENAYENPQCSACFIQSVDDDLMSIFDLAKNEARLFKYGSGTGTNFSSIRGRQEKLSGGGTSSGLMSFLEVLDRGAGATKSGGTTRRAAKMVSLDMDHPEIVDFITWKQREEKKAHALIAAGYPSDFNGEAYRTVGGQNSNNSVRVSDEFMNAVKSGSEWNTIARTTGKPVETFEARDLWRKVADAAWACADPGLQYNTTINEWHTCSNTAPIRGSNPCSEYMFLDNTACNLSSLNLVKFLNDDGSFNVTDYEAAARIFLKSQEILVDASSYPTKQIAQNSHDYRPLGLGYANLGSLLMIQGIPYDSDEGRAWAGALTAILTGAAYSESARIASIQGAFAGFETNRAPMLKVIGKHRAAADGLQTIGQSSDWLAPVVERAKSIWDEAQAEGEIHGYRNAQVSVLAPTGTIGLLMDCDTTGVEPDFALVKFKKLAGGGIFKIVNQSVPRALKNLGYTQEQREDVVRYVLGTMDLSSDSPKVNRTWLGEKGLTGEELDRIDAGLPATFELTSAFSRWTLGEETLERLGVPASDYETPGWNWLTHLGLTSQEIDDANRAICGTLMIEGAPHLKEEHLPVFDCANRCGPDGKRFIAPVAHIEMMAAAQPFLSGAISKTVNLPGETTVEEIEEIYRLGWERGLKAVALYRDGCKSSQPLSSGDSKKTDEKEVKAEAATESQVDGQTEGKAAEPALQANFAKTGSQLTFAPVKRELPTRRGGFTQEATVGGHKVFLRTGEYDDGTLGEVFIDMHKEGASYRSMMNCFAISVSLGLKYGVPLDEFVNKFTFTRFEPAGFVSGHANVKYATSLVDYIFRVLGLEYLGRTDFVQVKPPVDLTGEKGADLEPANPAEVLASGAPMAGVVRQMEIGLPADASPGTTGPVSEPASHLAELMGDAPPCGECGHTTVRNGSCYRCLNCGNSMGCS